MPTFSPDTMVQGWDGGQFSARDGVAAGFYTQDANGNVVIPDNPNIMLPNGTWISADLAAGGNNLNAPAPAAAAPAAPTAPKPPTAPTGPSSASLAASITNMLRQSGLDELIPMVDDWVRQGLTWPEIEVQLRDPTSGPGKVFDRLVPEHRLRREAGRTPISTDQILEYRRYATELFRESGLPSGFYDEVSDFTKLIVGDVSRRELGRRVQDGFAKAMSAPAETRDELQRIYGVNEGGLAAFFLDPDRALPLIERQFAAAKLGGVARRSGFGMLDRTESERLADLGLTEDAAQQGFGTLADSAQLFNALPGFESTETAITRQEQLGAAFENSSPARKRIELRARSRVAAFSGGGGFAQTREGMSGLGKAV